VAFCVASGSRAGQPRQRTLKGGFANSLPGIPALRRSRRALLAVRVALRREFDRFEKQVHAMARRDTRARLLMPVPGVGAIVSLTFAAAIDDPARFKSSTQVETISA
jgi:transposase